MDKREFISELEQALSVLQEEELRDILDEYEQHIDMKVESGLTESEAIEDFGSLTQLTAEILEAYHVRADYAAGPKAKGSTEKRDKLAEENERSGNGKSVLENGASICKNGCMALGRGIRKACIWIWGILGWIWRQVCRPFSWSWRMGKKVGLSWRERSMAAREDQGLADSSFQYQARNSGKEDGTLVMAPDKITTGQAGNPASRGRISDKKRDKAGEGGWICRMFGAVGHGIAHMVSLGVKAAFWCVRMAWNACCIGGSLLIAFLGLFCLYGFGVLVILLAGGYPLMGVTLGCFGLVLCTFSAAGFVLTLLWKPACARQTGARPYKKGLAGAFGIPDEIPPNRQRKFHGKDRSKKEMRLAVAEGTFESGELMNQAEEEEKPEEKIEKEMDSIGEEGGQHA